MFNCEAACVIRLMALPLPTYGKAFWLGHVVHLPGINNTSASAVKAMAIDRAQHTQTILTIILTTT